MEKEIITSWHANANNWINVIDNKLLTSRILVTNQAIENAILNLKPSNILDVGCGEGWLCRAMQKHDITTCGIDAIPALIDQCKQLDTIGKYYTYAYNDMAIFAKEHPEKFDAVVFNFALIGEASTEEALLNSINLLSTTGQIIIQTLHPFAAANGNFISGWRDGSWKGMEDKFTQPYQWYYRSMASWFSLFNKLNLQITTLEEPLHPETNMPLSAIFTLGK